jgi:hypothetical protein
VSSGGRTPLEVALVRVWRGDVPMGAGFLAGPVHVLTAAHVIADVLGLSPGETPAADATVLVDFPLLAPDRRLPATVVSWRPPGTEPGSDVAGLRLLEPVPAGARPVVLSRRGGGAGDQLVMVGFPRGLELGTWVYGRRGGPVATGWVEIESDPTRQATLAPGFSGTAVWSPDTDAVVGMVVYKVTGAGAKIGYMVLVDALLAAWPDLVDVIERHPPYRALRSFGEQDADLFYGREEQAEQIADLVRTPVPVIGVIGGSGVGKSSLWHAGVLPLLRTDAELAIVTVRPSNARTPLHALAFALDKLLVPDRDTVGRLSSVTALAQQLADGAMPDVVASVLDRLGAGRLLVAVDQFEEVLAVSADDRAAFAGALRASLAEGSRLSVLVNLRDTFLAPAWQDRTVAELARRWRPVTLGELTEAELRRVMTGPLRRAGTVGFADGLVERILDDLRRTPNPLPLLEFTLAELWQRRSAGWLTHAAYEEIGGIADALAGYADRVWRGLAPDARNTAELLLVQLVRPLPDGDLAVRRTVVRADCDHTEWTIAERLATTRLLVLHEVHAGKAAVPGVELAHDSLLTHWAALRALTEKYRDFRLWQESLRHRMALWSASGSARSRLLSGGDLRDAIRWAGTHGGQLSDRELAYVQASRVRRRNRLAGIAAVVVVALVATVVVYRHRSGQVAEATAKDLAAKVAPMRGYDSYGALQVALRAYRTDKSVGLGSDASSGSYDMVDKLLPDYRFTVPASLAGPPAASGKAANPSPADLRSPFEIQDLAQAASAGGTTMVSTDPAAHVVVWHLDGQRVRTESLAGLFGPGDPTTAAPVVGRGGRYVAFMEAVGPNFDPYDLQAPVDHNGLPKVDPSRYRTCVPPDIETIVPCLVVYDTTSRRVVVSKEVDEPLLGGSTLSIDPTGHVLGAVVSTNGLPRTVGAFHNTLYLYDLRTGRLLRRLPVPWRSVIGQLWLGPGGSTAILSEGVDDNDDLGVDREALSFVTIGPAGVRRRELAPSVTSATAVARNLDGNTMAALLPGNRLVTWAAATGTVTATISGLTDAEAHGALALDATGTSAWISSPEPRGNAKPADIEQSLPELSGHVTVRSLPGGTLSGTYLVDPAWSSVWPIGAGTNAPLVLVQGSTLGVMLTHPGAPPPVRRMNGFDGPGLSADRLCALLGEPNEDRAARTVAPSGAYQGPLCP